MVDIDLRDVATLVVGILDAAISEGQGGVLLIAMVRVIFNVVWEVRDGAGLIKFKNDNFVQHLESQSWR